MRKTIQTVTVAVTAFCATACPFQAPPQTVDFVDVEEYMGLWYEIASYPQFFNQGLVGTTAEYTLLEDGRVPKDIVGAMKEAGIPVTYVLYPDEGHGFAKPTNSLAFFALAENFLASCLGGRAEPVGNVLEPSTAEIVEGAEHLDALEAAEAS